MSGLNIQQHKFVAKAGMTAEDIRNSKEATSLQKKYASAFDTDGQKGFSQKEADLFNATTFAEKADGTVTFWTRQKDGTKKGTKFNSKDNNIQYKSDDEVKPYVKKVVVKKSSQKKEENVSFFDERWSGHQIARLTGDNVVTDWLQNKDKVCTDGKDDGKLSVGQYALSFAKGLIGGIPKAVVNHPVATALTVGVGTAATIAFGGAILPVLGAIGVAAGVGMAAYGTYKAATAETDGEAKQALETLGMGATTTALSMASASKALEQAAEAGVKSAQVSEDAGIIDKTVQMFKAIPEALKVGKNQYMSNKLGVTYESYISDGGKVYKSDVEQIHQSADNAVKSIVDNANRLGRELNEIDYARIERVRTQENALVQNLHLKAQSLGKDGYVRLIDADSRSSASVGFGNNNIDIYTTMGDKYYGQPHCCVGEDGYAAIQYAKDYGIPVEHVSPQEVKLDIWTQKLNKVSQSYWRYQHECSEKASNILSWYEDASAQYIDFTKADADRLQLLRYLKLSQYPEESINAKLQQFDKAVAAKRIELEAIQNNNAIRDQL